MSADKSNDPCVVRIAPSPSGYLHVGTARTAIFNWLYARKHNGKFLIRIEDTDTERSDTDLIQPILDALKWLGMESDEDIVYQSTRDEIHRSYVAKLLDSGCAYRCFCSKERLAEARELAMKEKRAPRYDRTCANLSEEEVATKIAANEPFVIRIKIPDGSTTYTDMVLSDITRENTEIEDFVVARADGSALYNLAVVVDDHEMEVTDVIRGNDHITNTFKQIHIYRALELNAPRFAHVPLLLRPDKRKISKRLGDKDVAEYGADGVLPQTMFNYLCLLGWSPKDGREIMAREEIMEAFDVQGINKNNPVFDVQKLNAFNKEHIKIAPIEQLIELIAPKMQEAELVSFDWLADKENQRYLATVINLMRERMRIVDDFIVSAGFFFTDKFGYDEKGDRKQFVPEAADRLAALADEFESASSFELESLEAALDVVAEKYDVKRAALIHPTRLAVSGLTVGPGLFDLLVLVGREKTLTRMRRAAEYIRTKKTEVAP